MELQLSYHTQDVLRLRVVRDVTDVSVTSRFRLLIYAVSFLGFFLPTESGDKVNLEITVLLALVVFLLIAGETLPPTPDAIPALGLRLRRSHLLLYRYSHQPR